MKYGFVFLRLLILVATGFNTVFAQTTNLQFRRLDVNGGLSSNQVNCFLKDQKGFLWIGTSAGLNRFDGYTIKIFINDAADPSSISSNSIYDLFETPDGLMGVFTTAGLNIYDPKTETFNRDFSSFYKAYNIPGGNLRRVFTDSNIDMCIIHSTSGLVIYDARKGTTTVARRSSNKTSISTDSVSDYCSAGENHAWVLHRNGILEKVKFIGNGYEVVYKNDFLYRRNNRRVLDYRLTADADGDLWLHVMDDSQGLYFFDSSENTFLHLHQKSERGRLNSNLISGVTQSSNKLIWVSTDHGGVNIIDKNSFAVQHILHRPEDDRSIGQNSLNTIYSDQEGIIWLGTFKKRVSYYQENLIRFQIYKYYPMSNS